MPRHYCYRVDHDLGFAPHIWRNVATVCGCKVRSVEQWAEVGSWVVGIGGNGTGKPNKLIYAMEVTATPSYRAFRHNYPANAAYLARHPISDRARVLVSRARFYYFGDRALAIPRRLAHIIHPTQGCKRLSQKDIEDLRIYVLGGLRPGTHGRPNNVPHNSHC